MPPTSSLSRELFLRTVVLRRLAALVGLIVAVIHGQAIGDAWSLVRVVLVLLAVCFYNEAGGLLFERLPLKRLSTVANTQIALDSLALSVLLHLYGSGIGRGGIVFFAPAFFVYGAVLPFLHALAHVVVTTLVLSVLGAAELRHWTPLFATGFFGAGGLVSTSFLSVSIAQFTFLNTLCCGMSHYLSSLLYKQEQRSRALLESNEREATRVRTLLEVAEHASATHTVDELLQAVCGTTIELVRVERAEIFLWDAEESCLRLSAAQGSAREDVPVGAPFPGHLFLVNQLRAGEVVSFAPRRLAAPMACHGWFEGALVLTLDEDPPDDMIPLAQGIARQATLAMVNTRSHEERREDAEVSRQLLALSRALSACLDEQALWRLLSRTTSRLLDLPWAVAVRFDEQSSRFRIVGVEGVPESALPLSDPHLSLERLPLLEEVLSNRDLVVADGSRPPHGLPGSWQVGAWLAIPLFRDSWVAGIVVAGRIEDATSFTRRDLRLAKGLGHHASIALHNARVVADLEAADRLKSEFVSTMSHELRTPLNVITGYTEMLREGALGRLTPPQLDVVHRLDARGRELLELIEATLQVGRLEAGRDCVEVVSITLADLITSFQANTAGLPRPETVDFEWTVPAEATRTVMTDRVKLSLAVRNLVGNALKFTERGKVTVHVALERDALVVEVTDTGVGIDAAHLPIIFDMFRQIDGSETRRHDGVGLGLYIVKQFVGRLGGTVEVRSTLGSGSTFRIALPGAARDEQPEAA